MSETIEALVSTIPLGYVETDLGVYEDLVPLMLAKYDPIEANFVDLEDDWSDDAEKIKPYIGATEVKHLTTRGKLTLKYRFSVEAFANFLILLSGNVDTSSASTAASEVQDLTIPAAVTAGGSRFTFRGQTTPEIAFDATAAARTATFEALSTIGAGGMAVTKVGDVYHHTFAGTLANTNVPEMTHEVITPYVGGVVTFTTATEGRAAGVRDHTVRDPSVCALNPRSFPYAEGLGCDGAVENYKLYPGCVVGSVAIEIDSRDVITLTVEVMTSGVEINIPEFDFPADESPITEATGGQVSVWVGQAFTDPYKVGRDELAKLSVKWDAGIVEPTRINDLDTVSEWQYGKGKPSIELSGTFKGGKSSRYYLMSRAAKGGEREKVRIVIDPKSTPQRRVTIDFNKTVLAAKSAKEGKEQRQDCTFTVLANATDQGKFTAVIQTSETAYLQEAP